MSTPYRREQLHPFPQLMVTLRTATETLVPVFALLDSGADVTLVPTDMLQRVGALEGRHTRMRGHFGAYHPVQLYLNDVDNDVILGRDVLNKLPLFLDGPQQQTELLDDASVKRLRARRIQSK